ncbi:MAG: metal-dependent hydrolase [Cytophagaceae bacterium]|nr:metal-dependent hydrolase [Cytophagaceae bacterium]|tara:strand:- start:11851 stop:12369 length:519 start_codon:yes stop_codon:yes gene_type:complete
MDHLKYPIGKYSPPENISKSDLDGWISTIENFPGEVKRKTENLAEADLQKTYRPGGWTLRQLVHHCADSHMNAFIRFKLALTEDCPTIKPYEEALWAELPDTVEMPINASLQILEGLHVRWAFLLENLTESQLQRQYTHPEHGKNFTLAFTAGMYSWHCNHHLAHMGLAIEN